MLRIAIVQANNLQPSDLNGSADPYCILTVPGFADCPHDRIRKEKQFKTSYISKSLNPRWQHICYINLEDEEINNPKYDIAFKFEVWDSDILKGESLGEATLLLSQIPRKRVQPHSFQLKKTLSGTLDIVTHLCTLDDIYYVPESESIPLEKADFSQFINLTLEGGGVKGLAYCGAVDQLEKYGILKNIKRISGTSAGAINAITLCLGGDAKKFKEVVLRTDIKNFITARSWGEKLDFTRIAMEFGIHSGLGFMFELDELLKELLDGVPGFDDDVSRIGITFAQLRTLVETQPIKGKIFRDAYFVGSNLSTGSWEVFSYETYPNTSLKTACRISMAIPYYFTSVKHEDCYWVDGGLCNNYPINTFDHRKYISDPRFALGHDADLHPFNKQTLGLRVDPVSSIFGVSQTATPFPPAITPIGCFGTFTNALLAYVLDNSQPLSAQDRDRTIFIDEANVAATDFDITPELKETLMRNGANSTIAFLKWFAAGRPNFLTVEDVPSSPAAVPAAAAATSVETVLSTPKVKASVQFSAPAQQPAETNRSKYIELKKLQQDHDTQYLSLSGRTNSLVRELSILHKSAMFQHTFAVLLIAILFYLCVRYYLACQQQFNPLELDDHLRTSDFSNFDGK